MTPTQTSIFLDGKIVEARNELIESLAPGNVPGIGVFETMRFRNGSIFVLDWHFQRLFRGLKLLGIRPPYSKKQLYQYLYRAIQASALKEARVRLAVWKENKQCHVAVICRGILSQKLKNGFKATISGVQRKRSRYSNIKSMDYGCFLTAFEEARNKGYDEGLLLNNRYELVEGSRTNIFYVKRGILYTPAIQAGCLNGITRTTVIMLARQSGIPHRAVCAGVRKLMEADEAFLTNSLIGLVPLLEVDRQLIGNGKPGPLTDFLMRAYETAIDSCPAWYKTV